MNFKNLLERIIIRCLKSILNLGIVISPNIQSTNIEWMLAALCGEVRNIYICSFYSYISSQINKIIIMIFLNCLDYLRILCIQIIIFSYGRYLEHYGIHILQHNLSIFNKQMIIYIHNIYNNEKS
ncbi:unnamed protein product [Paramecium sonneborni]|uniref:Uncharacterized protein n=1 Tax=Paramecium sonneborni TaxID=65129 RepID=A0A8S1NW72_9CILI|nr:unnamed protein product [Paramecium sonneborni]